MDVSEAADATGTNRVLLSVAAVLATLLYTIDSTIANVALPHMQGSLQATQDQIAWVLTSYIVVSAISTPLSGWLGGRYGLRRVLTVSVAGFTIASMLCGLAESLTQMVLFRGLQGAFGAALVPLSQVVLLEAFPPEAHGRATGLWGMGVMVGPIIGPTLGGYLTDTLSWRWAFYINVPVGIVAYLGILLALPKVRHRVGHRFDLTGFILLSLAIGLFQLWIDRGQTKDWFDSTEIVTEALLSGLFFYMFVVHTWTRRHTFVDRTLLRDRNFVVAIGMMFAIGLAVISPSVLLPNFLQQLQGYTPTQAGELMAVRGVTSIFGMLVAGRLVGRVSARLLIGVGITLTAVSLWIMAQFSLDTPWQWVVWSGAVQGFGVPLAFVPLSVVAYATLMNEQRAEAGALLTLMRNIGSSVGISTVVALLARSTQTNQSYLAEHFTAFDTSRWQILGGLPGTNESTAAFMTELVRQAAAIGYSNSFFLLTVVAVVSLPLVLLLKTAHAGGPPR
ncbi:MAG: DHA2 family efflux MFS transporter permease subunit [Gammaproteobacteria bacterium]